MSAPSTVKCTADPAAEHTEGATVAVCEEIFPLKGVVGPCDRCMELGKMLEEGRNDEYKVLLVCPHVIVYDTV